MLLEIGKAISFLASLMALYRVAISAFFLLATRWQERLWLMAPNVAVAVCVCLAAGMVFRWPARSNPEAGRPLISSLPVRMMMWGLPGVLVLFGLGWYLMCGNPLQVSPWCS